MNRSFAVILAAAALTLGACALQKNTYSPDVVRLQDDLARVEGDDRIALHAGASLDEAQRAVQYLVDEGRGLGDADFDHAIYLADRLIAIAAADGLARHAEDRARVLSTERESLLIDARTREARASRAAEAARLAAEEAAEAEADEED